MEWNTELTDVGVDSGVSVKMALFPMLSNVAWDWFAFDIKKKVNLPKMQSECKVLEQF